ncbi:MAG: hypothetical protein ACU0BF_01170 [Paracoccaceae bacterium]
MAVTRRRLTIALHWAVAMAVLVMTEGGADAPWLRWGYVALIVAWLAVMAAGGPLGRPGPKLTGAARAAFRPLHWALYAGLAASAALTAAELVGLIGAGPAFASVVALLGAGLLHGLFHLWRHTALRDGALRTITPRAIHGVL